MQASRLVSPKPWQPIIDCLVSPPVIPRTAGCYKASDLDQRPSPGWYMILSACGVHALALCVLCMIGVVVQAAIHRSHSSQQHFQSVCRRLPALDGSRVLAPCPQSQPCVDFCDTFLLLPLRTPYLRAWCDIVTLTLSNHSRHVCTSSAGRAKSWSSTAATRALFRLIGALQTA